MRGEGSEHTRSDAIDDNSRLKALSTTPCSVPNRKMHSRQKCRRVIQATSLDVVPQQCLHDSMNIKACKTTQVTEQLLLQRMA